MWSTLIHFFKVFVVCVTQHQLLRYDLDSPEGRRANTKLAGGFRACLVQLGGDLDYMARWLGFPRWSNHAKPCGICRATFRGVTSWMDNRENAKWLNTVLTVRNWRSHWTTACELFDVSGVNALCVAPDYMHNAYLGWLQYLYGSVFWLLCFLVLPHEALQNLEYIGSFIKEYQKRNPTAHKYRPKLTKLSMFLKQKSYPRLRGRAADIRGLPDAILALWDANMIEGDMTHRQIRMVLALNVKIADTLENYSPRFGYFAVPGAQANELEADGLAMAQLHSQLLESFEAQGYKIFNMTTKTHYCQHSLRFARYIHPYMVWCFKGETMMHKVQKLWKSCLAGAKHWAVANRAALRYRHQLHLNIKQFKV